MVSSLETTSPQLSNTEINVFQNRAFLDLLMLNLVPIIFKIDGGACW